MRVYFYHIALITAFCGSVALADGPMIIQPMSKYGQIQNAPNYSSNPFWDKNGPYNQTMPTPVYAMGTDLNAADCQSVVASLVAVQCISRNNCVGAKLSDIRPAIMVQLSRMPGHNYATSCGGFIDTAFDNYVAQYGYVTPSGAGFPTGTVSNPNANAQPYKPVNPYERKLPTAPGDPWAADMAERATQMKQMQAQTTPSPSVSAAVFPTTASDLSFAERMDIAQAGYAPFKDKSAYAQITVESDEKAAQRNRFQAPAAQPSVKSAAANSDTATPQHIPRNSSDRQRIAEIIAGALPK